MDYADLEMPECFSQKLRTARKKHKCCECHNEINVGDKYIYSSGIWAGIPASYKQCSNCSDIIDKFQKMTGYAIPFGSLREEFSDHQCKDDTCESWAKSLGVSVDKIRLALGDAWFD